jgi:hypothetical protein
MRGPFRTCCALLALCSAPSTAETTLLLPSADTSLYEEGDLANGRGQHLFAGTTIPGHARRALLRFDVAGALPPGAIVVGAELRLVVDRTIVGPVTVAVHRLAASWGEGASDADGQEGMGAPAVAGDTTWTDRLFPSTPWDAPGGDFEALASAAATVDGSGPVSWSGASLAADVQGWLDDPAGNFGWILIGDETIAPSAKRFGSREAFEPADSPALLVEWAPPPVPTLGAVASWAWVALLATAGCWAIARRR